MYRAIGKSCHVVPGKVPRQGWLNQQQHQSNRILPCVNNSGIEFDWQPTIAAWPLKSRRKVIRNLERRLAPDHPWGGALLCLETSTVLASPHGLTRMIVFPLIGLVGLKAATAS